MSMLLRVRGAWRAQSKRVASQLSHSTFRSPLPTGQWLQHDRALLQSPAISTMRAWSSAAAPTIAGASVEDDAKRNALIEQLRPLCSSLYLEHRNGQTVDELVAPWAAQISSLLQTDSSQSVKHEIAQTYEQGVAIALKQREFEVADALITQLKEFGLDGRPELYAHQIGAVPLRWVSRARPLSLDELRELDLGANWENALLDLIRADDQPHYRKSKAEQEQFHAFVRDGVTEVLAAYEADVPASQQRIEPYNAAVRAFAASGLPFAQMLRVLNRIPTNSSARRRLNAETFLALLYGARWNDIPLTIERLVKSNVLRGLQRKVSTDNDDAMTRHSHSAALIWDQAMRAIFNSYNDRFFDKRTPLDRRRIRDLQNIYLDVEAQLLRVFADNKFTSLEDHTAVYEIRVKTAALLGLPRQVHSLVREYKTLAPVEFTSGQLSPSVYFNAFEIFPSVGLKPVNARDIKHAHGLPDVRKAREVVELERTINDLEQNVIPTKKALMNAARDAETNPTTEKAKDAGRELRKAQQTVIKLKKRLETTTSQLAIETAHIHRLRAADRSIEIVLDQLKSQDGDHNIRMDLDVANAIMTQYMTTANRFAARMNHQTRAIMAEQIMRRVTELLETAVAVDVTESNRGQIEQLFSLATKTAALFWCEEDLQRLLRRKKTVLGTTRLDADDYDRLVFMRVAQLDVDGAIALLQEMHFAGVSPTPTTIHRVVTGVLHKLYRSRRAKKKDVDEDDDMGSNLGYNDDDEALTDTAAWSSGPSRLEDITSFLQEWYNLYRVKPMAKTVVPVFARFLATNNVWEVKRLLQILDSMEGGLAPVVEFWLEKRLAVVGKTVDDLRVTPKSR